MLVTQEPDRLAARAYALRKAALLHAPLATSAPWVHCLGSQEVDMDEATLSFALMHMDAPAPLPEAETDEVPEPIAPSPTVELEVVMTGMAVYSAPHMLTSSSPAHDENVAASSKASSLIASARSPMLGETASIVNVGRVCN
jgi:hypothetical protein